MFGICRILGEGADTELDRKLNRWLRESLLTRTTVAALRGTPLAQEPRQNLYALLVLEWWLRRVRAASG